MPKSAKLSRFEKSCFHSRTFGLHFLNFVDFFLGCMMLAFAMYLYSVLEGDVMDSHTAWLVWSTSLYGALLLTNCLCSFIALTSYGCRCCMGFSRLLSIFIIIAGFGIGSAAIALREKVFEYLHDHGTDIGLSQQNLMMAKQWYILVIIASFALVVVELIRMVLARGYAEAAKRVDNEFDALLLEEDKKWEDKINTKNKGTEQKYNDLRAYYKHKYGRVNTEDESMA